MPANPYKMRIAAPLESKLVLPWIYPSLCDGNEFKMTRVDEEIDIIYEEGGANNV